MYIEPYAQEVAQRWQLLIEKFSPHECAQASIAILQGRTTRENESRGSKLELWGNRDIQNIEGSQGLQPPVWESQGPQTEDY